MTETTENLFTEEEQKQIDIIKKYIEENKEDISKQHKGFNIFFYYDKTDKKVKVYDGLYINFSGFAVEYDNVNKYIQKIGKFDNMELKRGEEYHKGQLTSKTTENTKGEIITERYNKGQLTSKTTKNKERETIEESTNEYIKKYDYKDNNDVIEDIYLKDTPKDQQIKEGNKIFTSKHNTTNNTKTLTFYTTHPIFGGLSRNITIEIDENGIETLKDGDLTEEDKIKLKNTFEDKKNLALLINVIGDSCFYLNLIFNNQLITKDNILGKSRKTFLQQIEEKTTDGIIDYMENPRTGGEFIIFDKENKELGNLSLIRNKFYITNKDTGTIIPFSFKNIQEIKDKYNIFYIDKQKPEKKQQVSIEDENNIQTDKGIVLSFKKTELNNPNDELCLYGIYNGEFKGNTQKFDNAQKSKKLVNGQIEQYNNLHNFMQHLVKKHVDNNIKYEFNYINNQIVSKNKSESDEEHVLENKILFNNSIVIRCGEFKDNVLYSGSAYLRDNPTGKSIEQINPDKKIYTLDTDEHNNTRTLRFYGKVIGIKRDIQIHIDKNNIATLQGEPLTEDKTNKIKAFFNSIPVEQLYAFDDYLAILYYTTIMNKEEYKDTNILIPDLYKYYYKEGEEVDQTIAIINQIPQDKRKGKYIVPCTWLVLVHQVNLRIDFDNKICEIVNTGDYVDIQVINNLQQTLKEQYKGENWVVCENNIMRQSTGNCVIASNIVATEKTMAEKKVEDYNEKIKQLEEVDKGIETTKEKYKKQYEDFKKLLSVKDIDYEILVKKVFKKCKKWLEKENKTEIDDKSKLNFLLKKTDKKLEHLNNAEQQDENKKQKYEDIQEQIKQALDLLYIKELKEQIKEKEDKEISKEEIKKIKKEELRDGIKEPKQQKQQLKKELQELLNIIINNNKDKQTLTVEKLKQQAQSLLIQHNDKIEQVIINEILYNDLRNEVEKLKKEKQELQKQQQKEKQKDGTLLSTSLSTDINEEELLNELLQKQSIKDRINIIKQNKERLQIEKENFVRYNLISKERLFNDCGNQFNREASKDIVNEGNGIGVTQ